MNLLVLWQEKAPVFYHRGEVLFLLAWNGKEKEHERKGHGTGTAHAGHGKANMQHFIAATDKEQGHVRGP